MCLSDLSCIKLKPHSQVLSVHFKSLLVVYSVLNSHGTSAGVRFLLSTGCIKLILFN